MKVFRSFIMMIALLLAFGAAAADKLAVAEPVGKGGVRAEDIEAFWGMLESSIPPGSYRVISRGALKQMMTEIGLTTSSDLVNLNSAQKAKLGQLEGVKYILVSEIGKFGSRLNCTMKILDSSTGEIDLMRTTNLRVADLDELADKIEATLRTMLSDNKQLQRCALLAPMIRVPEAPEYLGRDFNVWMESGLMASGIRLQNFSSVSKILRRNNLDRLDELEPKMYVKVGKLLEVKMLIRVTVNRFEIAQIPFYVPETGAQGYRYIGTIGGDVRIVSAQDGELVASIPFEDKIDYRNISSAERRNWTPDDYGKYLIHSVTARIVPALAGIPALRGN